MNLRGCKTGRLFIVYFIFTSNAKIILFHYRTITFMSINFGSICYLSFQWPQCTRLYTLPRLYCHQQRSPALYAQDYKKQRFPGSAHFPEVCKNHYWNHSRSHTREPETRYQVPSFQNSLFCLICKVSAITKPLSSIYVS